MNNIKINISKDPKFGYSNLSFSEKPTEEMLQEMKSNGWRYSSHFKRWYPGTEEASTAAIRQPKNFFWLWLKKNCCSWKNVLIM